MEYLMLHANHPTAQNCTTLVSIPSIYKIENSVKERCERYRLYDYDYVTMTM